MLFAMTYWSGLKAVALDDVRERAGQVKPVGTLVGRRHDATIFEYPGHPAKLLGLRCLENLFAVSTHFDGVRTSGNKGLQRIAEVCRDADLSKSIAAVGRARGQTVGERPRFTLTINIIGRHNFDQREVRRLLLDWLRDGVGWVHSPSDYEVNVRLQVVRDKGFLGLAVAGEQMHKRAYKVSTRAGSLDPTVAYCVARLTEPTPGEVFMDPLCGAGTIAIERALGWPAGKVICGDIVSGAVEATRRNAEAASVRLSVLQWDARHLPLADGSVDKAAMNMPYGKDVPLGDAGRFIGEVLRETARVVRRGGRLTVISAHGRLILKWAARHPVFGSKATFRLPLHGFDASLLVFRRR